MRVLHFVTGGFSGATQVAVDLCLAAQRTGSMQVLLVLRRKRNTDPARIQALQAQGLDWPTIVITGHGDLHACRRAFKAGVTDFLTKPIEEQTLLEAIEAAQAKLRQLAERQEAQRSLQSLTERENEVLALITKGLGSKEIATALDISVRTVDTHRAKLAEKLGTGSVAEQTRLLLCAHHS